MTKVIRFPRAGVHNAANKDFWGPARLHSISHHHQPVDPRDPSNPGADRLAVEQSEKAIDPAVPAFVLAMTDAYREPGLPDPAMVVACALRWTTRRGRRLSSLPKLIRLQLDMLCDAGDPTALMVRDWIEGMSPLDLGDGTDANNAGTATADAHESGRA